MRTILQSGHCNTSPPGGSLGFLRRKRSAGCRPAGFAIALSLSDRLNHCAGARPSTLRPVGDVCYCGEAPRVYHPRTRQGARNWSRHATRIPPGPSQKEASMRKATLLISVCVMFLAVSIQAQAPQGPPKPGPEVKKLAYNVGTWNIEGDAKPFGPMPGGKVMSTEKCSWLSGGFFVTCHSEGVGPMGPEKSVSFMGYDA